MRKYLKIALKLFFTLAVIFSIIFIVYLILKQTGALDKIDSIQDLKETIKSFGIWGWLCFFILQFLQVTIIPIPSALTTLAGTILFGPWIAFPLSVLGIFTGSLLAFYLGRRFGKPLAKWIIGDSYQKLEDSISKGKYMFFLMLLFPFFPDDMLCLLAGATNMSYRFFINSVLIARPLSLFCLCFMGSGDIIPFSGWGIPVWIVMIMCLAVLMILSIKKQQEIEVFLNNLSNKMKLNQQKRVIKKLEAKNKK